MSWPRGLNASLGVALALALALAASGCGGGQKAAPVVKAPTLTFRISPSKTSNGGRPLRALLRAVTVKQFAEDQYRNVADLVVNPDDSVLANVVVFPGASQVITIERPAKNGVAVYFLFSAPDAESWKQLFDGTQAKIRLELGDNGIKRAPAP